MTRLIRTLSAALLCATFLLAASAASALPQTGAVEALTPRPVPGSKGVQQTTASIMQRQRRTPPPAGVRARPESEAGRKQLAQNPASPATPGAVTDISGAGPNLLGTGLNFTGATLADSLFLPPDSMGAVGPTQYLMAVNGRIRVFDKTTGAVGALNATTEVFFSSVRNSQFTSDPRVRYDRLSGRWFVVMINVPFSGPPDNRIMIAVSDGGTITGATVWTFFWFASDAGCLADFPTLGIDASALYVGVNDFCGANLNSAVYDSSQAYVVRKSSVLGAGPAVVTHFEVATPAGGAYTPQGVDNPTGDSAQAYFVGVDALVFGKLDLVRISNPGGSPTATQLGLTVAATSFPKNVPQPGSPKLLDAIDDRLTTATLQGGTLWTAHNISVNSSGIASSPAAGSSRTGIRWYALTNVTATPSVLRTGTVFDSAGANPLYLWMPALTVSSQGHVALGVSTGGTTAFANAAYTTMLLADSAFSSPAAYTSASSSYNAQPETVQRWGDYSNMSVDPCDGQSFWSVDEWAFGPSSWAVQIAKLLAPPPATPAGATPVTIPASSSNVSVQVTGTTANGAAFFGGIGNPACPFVATVTPGVTVNSASVVNAGQLSLNVSTVGTVAGPKVVSVTNPDGQSRSGAVLTVLGSLSVAPTVAFPGAAATVSGSSFAPGETVNLSWWRCTPSCAQVTTLGTANANGSGAFSKPITIPANAIGGAYFIVAVGATSGGLAFTPFFVQGTLSVSPPSGPSGSTPTVSGSNFAPNEQVALSFWTCTPSCSQLQSLPAATTNGSGAFSKPITIPNVAAGAYFVVAIVSPSNGLGIGPFTVTGGGPARAARVGDTGALATALAGDLVSGARSRTPRPTR